VSGRLEQAHNILLHRPLRRRRRLVAPPPIEAERYAAWSI
jgi:hypothetical protein